jgi:hypothetical protein
MSMPYGAEAFNLEHERKTASIKVTKPTASFSTCRISPFIYKMLNCFKSKSSRTLDPSKPSKPFGAARPSKPARNPNPSTKSHHHHNHKTMAAKSDTSPKLNTAELSSLAHWSMYGQPGASPPSRVLASDWKNTKPFKSPQSAPWNIALQPDQLEKLLLGFRPREMEDKWFVYAEGLDGYGVGNGNAVVRFYRSWTGFLVAEVEVVVGRGGREKKGEARVVGIKWEESENVVRGQRERDAKGTAREVCRWVLGVDLGTDE